MAGKNLCQADGSNKAPDNAGNPLTRAECLMNAKPWMDKKMLYSQQQYDSGYRTDCSGFVSRSWNLKTSMTTTSLSSVGRQIEYNDLKPCDALLKRGSHVRLFYSWADAGKTRFTYWHEGGTTTGTCSGQETVTKSRSDGYVALRYNNIRD